jgi:hypothetical protein
VILITASVIIVLAIGGVIAWLVHQARQDRRAPLAGPAAVRQLPPPAPQATSAPEPQPGIEVGDRHLHIHLHGTDPAEVAALIRRIDRSDP